MADKKEKDEKAANQIPNSRKKNWFLRLIDPDPSDPLWIGLGAGLTWLGMRRPPSGDSQQGTNTATTADETMIAQWWMAIDRLGAGVPTNRLGLDGPTIAKYGQGLYRVCLGRGAGESFRKLVLGLDILSKSDVAALINKLSRASNLANQALGHQNADDPRNGAEFGYTVTCALNVQDRINNGMDEKSALESVVDQMIADGELVELWKSQVKHSILKKFKSYSDELEQSRKFAEWEEQSRQWQQTGYFGGVEKLFKDYRLWIAVGIFVGLILWTQHTGNLKRQVREKIATQHQEQVEKQLNTGLKLFQKFTEKKEK